MLSSAVHNCWQTGVRPRPQSSVFSMLIPSRPPITPLLCESLCNFGEIHTKNLSESFLFLSLSPSFSPSPPFLDIPEWHHSLLPPLGDITLRRPPLWTGPTSTAWSGIFCSCGLIGRYKKRNNHSVSPETISGTWTQRDSNTNVK